MKRLFILVLALSMILAFAGCNWIPFMPEPVVPVEPLTANVEIIDWEQNEEAVVIYYTITNTGTVSIDNYQIEFLALCADGSIYGDWTSMFEDRIGVGDYVFADFEIAVFGCDVISVAVGEWELIHWEF